MNPIESKELRGLTIKSVWAFISTAAIIILAMWRIVAGYSADVNETLRSHSERLLKLESIKTGDEKYINLRLDQLRQNIEMTNTRIDFLQRQVEDNNKFILKHHND